MGIISRFKDIMAANFNAILDKAEDPEKMIDQYLRELNSDLGNVKAETAAIMAEETRAKREYDEAVAEVAKYQMYAEKAVAAGNDSDARVFLQQKNVASIKCENQKKIYEAAAANSLKMRQMHDKLVKDINDLNAKKETIKAKVAVAKTQEKINSLNSSVTLKSDAQSAMSKLNELEDKIDKRLDTANAMAQLNAEAEIPTVEDLAAKYDITSDAHSDVDDELAALKAKMGMRAE